MEGEPKKNVAITDVSEGEIKLYKKRWFISFLYVIYPAVTGVQWMQYCIISNIITKYYGVSARAVDWTSLIMMLMYPVMLFPGTYVIDKLVSSYGNFQISFMNQRHSFMKYIFQTLSIRKYIFRSLAV